MGISYLLRSDVTVRLCCAAAYMLMYMATGIYCQCTVVNDEAGARVCLNVTDTTVTTIPLPIIMNSRLDDKRFICDDDKPFIYTFTCTHYGRDAIWYVNNVVITFQYGDKPGEIIRKTYPESPENPLINITAVLVEVDNSTIVEYNVPFCVTTLTVYPHDEVSDFKPIPFNISCRTYCTDGTEVCQMNNYNIAAKPDKPKELTNHTIAVDNSKPSTRAVVSFNWSSPENNNYNTSVTNYKFTLINASTNGAVITSVPLLNSSYTQVVTTGRYNVSVSAIDLCGQESEPSTMELEVEAISPAQMQTSNELIVGLVSATVVFSVITLVLVIIILLLNICICWLSKSKPTEKSE